VARHALRDAVLAALKRRRAYSLRVHATAQATAQVAGVIGGVLAGGSAQASTCPKTVPMRCTTCTRAAA